MIAFAMEVVVVINNMGDFFVTKNISKTTIITYESSEDAYTASKDNPNQPNTYISIHEHKSKDNSQKDKRHNPSRTLLLHFLMKVILQHLL